MIIVHLELEYGVYLSVCPIVAIGCPHPLLPQARVCLPPGPKGGGGGTDEGVGEPNSDDWIESLALCISYSTSISAYLGNNLKRFRTSDLHMYVYRNPNQMYTKSKETKIRDKAFRDSV